MNNPWLYNISASIDNLEITQFKKRCRFPFKPKQFNYWYIKTFRDLPNSSKPFNINNHLKIKDVSIKKLNQ